MPLGPNRDQALSCSSRPGCRSLSVAQTAIPPFHTKIGKSLAGDFDYNHLRPSPGGLFPPTINSILLRQQKRGKTIADLKNSFKRLWVLDNAPTAGYAAVTRTEWRNWY